MSNGSILDLVAKGVQDMEVIDINNMNSIFNFDINKGNKVTKGDVLFYPQGKANWGNTIRFNIERKGDLLYGLYLVVRLPKLSISNLNTPTVQNENDSSSPYRVHYADFLGNIMIEKISLYFNGMLIDEQYGDYMQFYTDLYISDWNRKAMLGMDDVMNKPNLKIESESIYIPFKFWFCNDMRKPLPVIAMQHTDIYVDITFRKFVDCVSVLEIYNGNLYHSDYKHSEVPIIDCVLQSNFYYLDLEERKNLATKDYEILITQSQTRIIQGNNMLYMDLTFNNIVKDIFFVIQPNTNIKTGEYFNTSAKLKYPPNNLEPVLDYKLWQLAPKKHLLSRARLLFNGIERIEWRDAKYFYFMQNHENYKNTLQSYVYVYSFVSNPTKEISYAGCNFSRIDNAVLQVEIKPEPIIINSNGQVYVSNDMYELKCFATNFNTLVIKGGLAGLKYQN
jgi:hypothetical protein